MDQRELGDLIAAMAKYIPMPGASVIGQFAKSSPEPLPDEPMWRNQTPAEKFGGYEEMARGFMPFGNLYNRWSSGEGVRLEDIASAAPDILGLGVGAMMGTMSKFKPPPGVDPKLLRLSNEWPQHLIEQLNINPENIGKNLSWYKLFGDKGKRGYSKQQPLADIGDDIKAGLSEIFLPNSAKEARYAPPDTTRLTGQGGGIPGEVSNSDSADFLEALRSLVKDQNFRMGQDAIHKQQLARNEAVLGSKGSVPSPEEIAARREYSLNKPNQPEGDALAAKVMGMKGRISDPEIRPMEGLETGYNIENAPSLSPNEAAQYRYSGPGGGGPPNDPPEGPTGYKPQMLRNMSRHFQYRPPAPEVPFGERMWEDHPLAAGLAMGAGGLATAAVLERLVKMGLGIPYEPMNARQRLADAASSVGGAWDSLASSTPVQFYADMLGAGGMNTASATPGPAAAAPDNFDSSRGRTNPFYQPYMTRIKEVLGMSPTLASPDEPERWTQIPEARNMMDALAAIGQPGWSPHMPTVNREIERLRKARLESENARDIWEKLAYPQGVPQAPDTKWNWGS